MINSLHLTTLTNFKEVLRLILASQCHISLFVWDLLKFHKLFVCLETSYAFHPDPHLESLHLSLLNLDATTMPFS